MRILDKERHHAVTLLGLLQAGEKVAARCAERQANLTQARLERRFFKQQARQEHQHALVFGAGILAVDAKGQSGQARARFESAIRRYEAVLKEDLQRCDLAASVLGQQVVLEGFAEHVLVSVDSGIESRGGGYRRIRKTILGQEMAHASFGQRWLGRAVSGEPGLRERLESRAQDYLSLIDGIIRASSEVMEVFEESAEDFRRAAHQSVREAMGESI